MQTYGQRSGALERIRCGGVAVLTITTMLLAGCGGGGGGGASPASAHSGSGGETPGPGPDPDPGANAPPRISGIPVQQINAGDAYNLAPAAEDPDGDTLAFSIENKPSWASFNTATGQLSGTPDAEDIGAYADVVISVSDGKMQASLPTFSITVADASDPVAPPLAGLGVELSWDVPTTLVDGGLLNDLAGYRIHYGRTADMLTEAIEIPSAGVNRYSVQDLEPGTYYFVVRAVTASGAQSDLSNVVSVEIG